MGRFFPLASLLLWPGTFGAQDPSWTQPFVSSLRVFVGKEGAFPRQELSPGQRLELEAGSQVVLKVEARDQRGLPFPQQYVLVFWEGERRCDPLLGVSPAVGTHFQLRAGTQRGRCAVQLVAAGNLNVVFPLEVEVTSLARRGYSRAQAEYVVTCLYRGLLGREPDPPGFAAAVQEVQRNRTGSLIEGMLRSREFREKWQHKPPAVFLEQLCQGLLGRPPSSAEVGRYLSRVEKGKLKEVVAELLHSEEFEGQMLAHTSP